MRSKSYILFGRNQYNQKTQKPLFGLRQMNLSKRTLFTIYLITGFSIVFIVTFLTIQFTQSAYSTPGKDVLAIEGMHIILGPPPNSTNIPLDTTITIDTLASAALNDLRLTPEVLISHVTSYVSGPLSYEETFHPAHPLNPSTSYTVSVTILDVPVSWTFTTTSETFNPGISFYLATNKLLIASSVAAIGSLGLGTIISHRQRN